MSSRRSLQSALAPGIFLLGAGLVFGFGPTGCAGPDSDLESDFGRHTGSLGVSPMPSSLPRDLKNDALIGAGSDEPKQRVDAAGPRPGTPTGELLRGRIGLRPAYTSSRADRERPGETTARLWDGWSRGISADELELLVIEAEYQERRARAALHEIRATSPSGATGDETREPSRVPPSVNVRVSDHGDFERVVFEWPAAVDHQLMHLAEQVIVSFSRPGRIDLASLQERFGDLVVGAWAEGGEVTKHVVLRLSPDASARSFSLENDRVVVIDVLGGSVPRNLARTAPAPEQASIEELKRALRQRDAIIENLLARVERLERKVVLSSDDLDRAAAGAVGSTPSVGGSPLPRPRSQSGAADQHSSEPAAEPSAGALTTATAGQEAPSPGQGAKPGEFEVDEEEIDRALERTLVQTGVLLLPTGQAEIEPFFSYTRQEDNAPVLFADGGLLGTGNQEVRRDEFVPGLALRVGLPFDSQVELDLPYRYVQQSVVTPVGVGQREEEDDSGHGLGDLRIGVAKTLLREDAHWWPDLVARVSWDTDTGKTSDNDVVLGGGFHELRGSLSAIKRQDPLAFTGTVSYETSFENNDVDPGDELGFNIGTFLAASPGTSLRLALGQTFIDNTKINGEGINGSDRVVGMATLGASVVLGRGVLLDVAADIGLTDDAPDYAARVSLPIRFNLPTY